MNKTETLLLANQLLDAAKALYLSVDEELPTEFLLATTHKKNTYALPMVSACQAQLKEFVKECVVEDKYGGVFSLDLYCCYNTWAKNKGIEVHNLTRFGRALPLLGINKQHKREGSFYTGIKIKE